MHKAIAIILAVLVGALIGCAAETKMTETPEPEYPADELANEHIRAKVYLPDADRGFARGPRFEWGGQVARVATAEHVYFGPWWSRPYDPTGFEAGIGLAEEFGMHSPLGYDEAAVGESFVKIGIGELQRNTEEPYAFWRNYPVANPAPWRITRGDDWVRLEQNYFASASRNAATGDNADASHYGYRLIKWIELAEDAPAIRITRVLTNTGSRPIDTTHYCHNFIVIDDEPAVGLHYQLDAAFDLEPMDDDALHEIYVMREGRLTFVHDLAEGQSGQTTFRGTSDPSQHRFNVANTRTDGAVSVRGDYPIAKLNVWSMNPVMCPEPFVDIDLAPGESMTWTNAYMFE